MSARKLYPNDSEKTKTQLTLLPAPNHGHPPYRIPLLDATRGTAIVLMVLFHLAYDLKIFTNNPPSVVTNMPIWFWKLVPLFIGTLFFLCFGASLKIAHDTLCENLRTKFVFLRTFRLTIVASGITVVTTFFTPQQAITFGVIHCMAVCTLVLIPLLSRPLTSLLFGATCIALGVWLNLQTFGIKNMYWLGFRPKEGFLNSDYFPLFPWLGVALCGVFLIAKLRDTAVQWQPKCRFWKPILTLGRNSLIIYITHQPILLLTILGGEYLARLLT